jgi:hypothetical protein
MSDEDWEEEPEGEDLSVSQHAFSVPCPPPNTASVSAPPLVSTVSRVCSLARFVCVSQQTGWGMHMVLGSRCALPGVSSTCSP